MHFKFLIALLLTPFLIFADPWGKDADLSSWHPKPPAASVSSNLALGLIRFHQEVVSPADGPRSHYIPSSSQYTYEAIRDNGFFKGWILGCDRLMRENDDPWVYPVILNAEGYTLKWDPVR